MNTDLIKRDLLASLKDQEYRHAWNLENVYATLCFQIRALREQRGWSQKDLGRAAKMAQERISILEDPNAETKPSLTTLVRLADGLDVGLEVKFVSYGRVIETSTNTDFHSREVPSFEDELPELERELDYDSDAAAIHRHSATTEQMRLALFAGANATSDTHLKWSRYELGLRETQLEPPQVSKALYEIVNRPVNTGGIPSPISALMQVGESRKEEPRAA